MFTLLCWGSIVLLCMRLEYYMRFRWAWITCSNAYITNSVACTAKWMRRWYGDCAYVLYVDKLRVWFPLVCLYKCELMSDNVHVGLWMLSVVYGICCRMHSNRTNRVPMATTIVSCCKTGVRRLSSWLHHTWTNIIKYTQSSTSQCTLAVKYAPCQRIPESLNITHLYSVSSGMGWTRTRYIILSLEHRPTNNDYISLLHNMMPIRFSIRNDQLFIEQSI